jgi:hypothetical protein
MGAGMAITDLFRFLPSIEILPFLDEAEVAWHL